MLQSPVASGARESLRALVLVGVAVLVATSSASGSRSASEHAKAQRPKRPSVTWTFFQGGPVQVGATIGSQKSLKRKSRHP